MNERRDNSGLVYGGLAVLGLLGLVVSGIQSAHFQTACEKKGGVVIDPDGSRICMSKATKIEVVP